MNTELQASFSGVYDVRLKPVNRSKHSNSPFEWERGSTLLLNAPGRVVGCEFDNAALDDAGNASIGNVHSLVCNDKKTVAGQAFGEGASFLSARYAVMEIAAARTLRREATNVDRAVRTRRQE